MSGRIGKDDQAVYRALVDVLLPAGGPMPAGNDVGVADAGLDRVLEIRPDIIVELLAGIQQSRDLDPNIAVLKLQQGDAEIWHAMRVAAFGAYYNAPRIQAILGYAGQPAYGYNPDEVLDYVRSGLINQVIARARAD